MDPISITTGCTAVTEAIVKASPALRLFIREVREARTELDAVLAETQSLEGVIDILKDDASSFPSELAQRTPPVLTHCASILDQIDGYMFVCNAPGLSKRDKRFRWLAIRADMMKLRLTLEGYKSILALVTDLVGLTKSHQEIASLPSVETDSLRYHDILKDLTTITTPTTTTTATTNNDIKIELTHLLADMGSLRGRLQGDFRSNYAVSDLESYLDAMQLDATNLGHRMNVRYSMNGKVIRPLASGNSVDSGRIRFPSSGTNSSMGDEPDSAIDINDGPPSPYQRSSTVDNRPEPEEGCPAPPNVSSMPVIEIDEFLDELSDGRDRLSRAPTPPPKARARRFSVAENENLLGTVRPAPSVRSVSDYGPMGLGQEVEMDDDDNDMVPRQRNSIHSHAESENDARSTLGSLMGICPAFSDAEDDFLSKSTLPIMTGEFPIPQNAAPTPSKDDRTGRNSRRLLGRNHSFSVPGRPTRPDTSTSTLQRFPSQKPSLEEALYGSSEPGAAAHASPVNRIDASAVSATELLRPTNERKASVDTKHTFLTTSSSSAKAPRPSTGTAASVRSSGSRMSSVFSRMTLWKPKRSVKEAPVEDTEPDAIFGVSLKKSMQIATATVRTHHNGSKGSSRREFPRVVFTCVSFIKENHGIKAPNIFGENYSMDFDKDHMMRVADLKQCFSTAPHYGEGNIDWEQYDVYDAAEMIVLFLQQLPKPLITETVAKRWIVLSRQASVPGSMGMRLDSCIDFWDEALLGVRGAARSMFKLLLNLWGDIADAADVNDMTAERLASRLLNPLMHLPAGKYTTDLMLGLAFLIRKRSEYAVMLGEGRQSKAAF